MSNGPVLIDSSVWIEYFRNGKGEAFNIVDALLDSGKAVLCGIVEMEIFAGMRKNERTLIKDLFSALHYINIERKDFRDAGERLNTLRKKGITVPASDCLIAALALNRNLPLLTLDKHFDYFTELKRITF